MFRMRKTPSMRVKCSLGSPQTEASLGRGLAFGWDALLARTWTRPDVQPNLAYLEVLSAAYFGGQIRWVASARDATYSLPPHIRCAGLPKGFSNSRK